MNDNLKPNLKCKFKGDEMKNKDIKRRIIDTTKELMRVKNNITIKDIAEACYINIASVNYHFGSKDNLINIALDEVVDELKEKVILLVNFRKTDESIESFLEELIHYIYNFVIEHVGILNYLFLTKETQAGSSQTLIETFFSDNEFTNVVYANLRDTLKIDNEKEVFARYMMLFSAFSIPLFIQMSELNQTARKPLDTFKDPEFRKYYINQLMKMIEL